MNSIYKLFLFSMFMFGTGPCSAEENEIENEGVKAEDEAEELVKEVSTTEELVDLICSCREEAETGKRSDGEYIDPLNPHPYPRDCYDIQQLGQTESGAYDIFPFTEGVTGKAVRVWCDMDTDEGGWTVFQRRQDGTVDFYLDWAAYKAGFGYVGGEHWLGNDDIWRISKQRRYILRVDLEDWDDVKKFAKYDLFALGDESTKYKLVVGKYTGDAGDSLAYHSSRPFSTTDEDNDAWSGDCVASRGGPWWYGGCEHSDLNGKYLKAAGDAHKGVTWHHFKNNAYSLRYTEMKIRPSTPPSE